MFTKLAQYGLRLIGASAVLSAGAAFVAPPLAEAAAEERSVTTTQTLKLPTHEEYKASLAAQVNSVAPLTTETVAQAETVSATTPTPSVAVPITLTPLATPAATATAVTPTSTKPPTSSPAVPKPTSPNPLPTAVKPVTPEPSTPAPTSTPTPKPTTPKPTTPPTSKPPVPKPPVKPVPKPTPPKVVHSVVVNAKILAVLTFARAQIGERYVMGGAGPSIWDCSGLTMMAFSHIGINIGGHGVNVQYNLARSKGYLVPWAEKKAGDLVFYGVPGNLSHVAIYSGGGKIIEAANPARPVIERPYWGTPYHMVARFIR